MNDESFAIQSLKLSLAEIKRELTNFHYIIPPPRTTNYSPPPVDDFIREIATVSELTNQHPLDTLLSYYGADTQNQNLLPFHFLFDLLIGEGEFSKEEALAVLNHAITHTLDNMERPELG
jgi:hypothetical protein